MSTSVRRRRRTATERALLSYFGDTLEAPFQRQVMADLRRQGYLSYHTANSRKSAAGYPDVTAVLRREAPRGWRPPFVLVLEVKKEAGVVEPAQVVWGEHFRAVEEATAGALWYRVVRPSTWGRLLATITETTETKRGTD